MKKVEFKAEYVQPKAETVTVTMVNLICGSMDDWSSRRMKDEEEEES